MSKTSKNKGGKIPKLTEEEYTKYISSLRGGEESLNASTKGEKNAAVENEKEKE